MKPDCVNALVTFTDRASQSLLAVCESDTSREDVKSNHPVTRALALSLGHVILRPQIHPAVVRRLAGVTSPFITLDLVMFGLVTVSCLLQPALL